MQAIEWFFDQQIAGNLIIIESTCSLFGAPDAGYPTNRMTYDCTGRPTTYKATISNLDGTEEGEWGVRFSFTDSSISNYDRSPFSLCTGKLDRQNSIYYNPALNKWGFMVWSIFFLMNVFFALNGSKLFYYYLLDSHFRNNKSRSLTTSRTIDICTFKGSSLSKALICMKIHLYKQKRKLCRGD